MSKVKHWIASFFVFLPLVLGGEMPITTVPTGFAVYPILGTTATINTGTEVEVEGASGPLTRFWMNERHIPDNARVRLFVRARTDGTANVRLSYAESVDVTNSGVYIDDTSLDSPSYSVDFRANLIDEDSDSLFCLEAETDGVNTLLLYGAWLLVEW